MSVTQYEKSFKSGDRVVLISGACTDIFEIDRRGRDGEIYDTRWRLLRLEHFRHATKEEIEAGRRIDKSLDN